MSPEFPWSAPIRHWKNRSGAKLLRMRMPPHSVKGLFETGQAALQTPAAGNGNGIEALNSLLVSGAQFLMNLSQAISQPPQEKKSRSCRPD